MAKLGKAARMAERKRLKNKPIRSKPRTAIDEVEKLLAAKKPEEPLVKFKEAQRSLDRAVKKGVLHLNNAARRKSRLMKKINASRQAAQKT